MLVKMLAFLLPKNTQIFLKLFSPQWADFKPYQMLAELPCEVMVFSRQGSRITITNQSLVNLLNDDNDHCYDEGEDDDDHHRHCHEGDVRRQSSRLSEVARCQRPRH